MAVAAELAPPARASFVGRGIDALGHLFTKKRLAAGGAVAGIFAAIFAGGNEPSSTAITNAGHGTIDSLTLGPGKYCNAVAEVNMQDVSTRYTHFIGKIILGQHIGVHAWTQETMSGELEAQLCVWTKHKRQAIRHGDKYDLTLTPGDFTFIIYPKDPTQMKYTPDNSNVEKISDATLGNAENDLNLIPGVNLHGKAAIQEKLEAIDLLEGDNYLTLKCGPPIESRLTATNVPGGNMQTLMDKDLIHSIPGADGRIDPNSIIYHFTNDGSVMTNQYSDTTYTHNATSVFADVEKDNNGLSFPTVKQMTADCKDIVAAVGHVG